MGSASVLGDADLVLGCRSTWFLRSHYVASVFAAPLMIEGGGGLIICISAPGSMRYVQNVAYGVGKAGVEKL